MMKTKPYKELREKMSPKARAAAAKKTKALLDKLPDGEVRINQFTDTDSQRHLKTTG